MLLTGAHTLVLAALRYCLESELDITACVSELTRVSEAVCSGPDAVVFHFPASRAEGLGQLHRLREVAPGVAVVVLAEDGDPRLAAEAFGLGVRGWVLKSSTVPDLTAAVRAALSGRRYLTPLVAGGDIDSLPEPEGLEVRPLRLRPREREVLQLLAEGKVMREIGAELGITPRTVAFHKYRMMGTLGVRSTAELLRVAVREEQLAPRPQPERAGPAVSVPAATRSRPAGHPHSKERRR